MRIKPGYILKKVMGKYMIVSLEESASQTVSMQSVNETGAFIWGELEKGASTDDILRKMLSEYDVESHIAQKDISVFISKLDNAGILEH